MPPFFSPYGMDYISVAVPSWLDLATVIVGALAGIIVARERHLDLVGFVGLGLLGGLGGGLIRDVTSDGASVVATVPYDRNGFQRLKRPQRCDAFHMRVYLPPCATSSSCVPASATRPPSMTAILSAVRMRCP